MDFRSVTTRGGDSGQTGLADGSRRSKDDLLIEVLGDIDELHAALGMLKTVLTDNLKQDEVTWVENMLIRMGGMLAVPPTHPKYSKLDRIDNKDIELLESWQKEIMARIEIPEYFIVYGDSEGSARADMARAVCRRAERHLVSLIRQRVMIDLSAAQRFLNRLSDYLYVYARFLDDNPV